MTSLITDIITRFGPRAAGSDAEYRAQQYLRDKLRELTSNIEMESFEAALDGRFGQLKHLCILFWFSLVLYFSQPYIALVLALLSAFFIFFCFMQNRSWLDFLFTKRSSWNVNATLEPQQKATRTILLTGHMDSTHEYIWWYWFKQFGATLTLLAGLLMVLWPFAITATLFLPDTEAAANWKNYIGYFFAALSPITLVYFFIQTKRVVPGAQDNLSGISIAYHTFAHFASAEKGKSTLQHTRLRFASFGSEEKGLLGSTAFSKAHYDELLKENTSVINLDSVRLVNEVSLVSKEIMSGAVHDASLIENLKAAFAAKCIPLKCGAIPIGGTDAAPFSKGGIPAVSIIGISMKKLDPTYHTRLDTVENLEPQALENVRNGLIEFLQKTDT